MKAKKGITCSVGVSLTAQFARESAMLKLPEGRRRWGESRETWRGGEWAPAALGLPENTVNMRNTPYLDVRDRFSEKE